MPSGLTPTLANRKPVYVGDDAMLSSLLLQNSSGTVGALRAGRNIISGVGATRTLAANESGSICLFDRAAGVVYTLPAPVPGLRFTFITTVTITSGAAEVDTDAGTTFMLGAVNLVVDNSATSKGFQGNGSSHVKISSNGTTSGGIKGSRYDVECVSSTVWNVNGNLMASGAIATPFA